MPRSVRLLAVLLFLWTAALYAAGDWSVHTDQANSFSFQYPSGWQIQPDAGNNAFSVVAPSGDILFNLEIEPLDEALRNQDWLEYTQEGVEILRQRFAAQGHTGIKVLGSFTDTLNARIVHRVELASSPRQGLSQRSRIIRIKRGDRHILLTFSAADGTPFAQAETDFERVAKSLRFLTAGSSYLDDYIRVRADLYGAETVWHWTGKAYGFVPGEKRRELFDLEGYHILRAVPIEGGYQLAGREVVLFLDHRSGQVLQDWRNPYTGKDVAVFHAFNDPVSQTLTFTAEELPLLQMFLPSQVLDGRVIYHSDLFPYYPNPLPRREFPLYSQGDVYQAAEFTEFQTAVDDLADAGQTSVTATYSFTRIYPWLPFMEMADAPGYVIWVGRGHKLEGGFSALPQYLREHVLTSHPEFASAPEGSSGNNATLWTSFRQWLQLQPASPEEPTEP